MYADHENARDHVRKILAALDNGDKEMLARHLKAYQELLTEHIKKEDEILYPWMDRNLSLTQIGELFLRFGEKDEEFGDAPEKNREFISELENKLNKQEVIK
jgi:hemerythrin-like domain-containing protein